MCSQYQNIDTNLLKTCLKEVGDPAKQNGHLDTFKQCAAEWKQVDEYEKSLIAPWD